jgi:hypothetical protein
MPVEIKWFGDKVLKDSMMALSSGVNDSNKGVYDGWQKTIDVDTGRSKSEMKIIAAKVDGDETFGMVVVPTPYAVFNELDSSAGRRAMMANETKSLKNFEGRLK